MRHRAAPGRPPGAARRPGAAVTLTGVRRSFGPLVPALRDVTFSVAAGEIVLLAGPSGSGKSTILNAIAGLDRPDGGEVLVDGEDVAALRDPARFRREVVGFVFQLHHLLLELSAQENVEIPLVPEPLSRAERHARARAALERVGLAGRVAHRPGQLSGGERQLTALARAIVTAPRLLLADEPTGALDTTAGARVLALLTTLARDEGMTVLLVSHDPQASVFADRVLHLRDGRIVGEDRGGAAPPDAQPSASAGRSRVTHHAG